MIDILLYDKDKNERVRINSRLSDSVAMLSDDQLKCSSFGELEKVYDHLSREPSLDLSMLEVSGDADIVLTKHVRECREQADMMLVADGRISPMKYMTPDIRACSLLLKPFSDDEMKTVVHEFVSSYLRKRETPSEENSIVIENRDGRIVVPLSHIYYIEEI